MTKGHGQGLIGSQGPPVKDLMEVGTWEGEKPVVPRPTESTWPTSPVSRLCSQGDDLDVSPPPQAFIPLQPALPSIRMETHEAYHSGRSLSQES